MRESEYVALLRRARQRHLALDVPVARRLSREIGLYADRLAALLRGAGESGRWTERHRRALLRAARHLSELLDSALEEQTLRGMRLSAERVAEIVDRATARFIDEGSPAGYVSPGDLQTAGAYAARITADNPSVAAVFRTIAGHVGRAAGEVDRIISSAMLEGVAPEVLARRLRGYMTGSEQFGAYLVTEKDAAGKVTARKIDLRKIPKAERHAARTLDFNARRIAVTEMHSSAHEATAEAMDGAPMVRCVRWRTSSSRGSGRVPDECDVLARADLYGLGPGRYPTGRVPREPHPFGRCYTIPEFRPFREWEAPKPRGHFRPHAARLVTAGTEANARRAVAAAA